MTLFERALIAAALYEDIWIRVTFSTTCRGSSIFGDQTEEGQRKIAVKRVLHSDSYGNIHEVGANAPCRQPLPTSWNITTAYRNSEPALMLSCVLQYARYLERRDVESAREVYRRACGIHLTKKPNPHLAWSAFEEKNGYHLIPAASGLSLSSSPVIPRDSLLPPGGKSRTTTKPLSRKARKWPNLG